MHIKTHREQMVFSLLVCLVVAVFSGCTSLQGENVSTQESELVLATAVPTVLSTPTPTVEITPTILLYGSDPFPFSLNEVKVFCQYLGSDTTPDNSHWADALIPGVSTIDDLLALTSIPDDILPTKAGVWRYASETDNARFMFIDGVLYLKGDPRTKLGEIIQYYGHPETITWEIPRSRYDEASYATYLIYPEHRAFFYAWDKVTWFTTDTDFWHSNFFTQDEFDAELSALTYPDYNRYEELVWPCEE
jgi:hypothetical protein